VYVANREQLAPFLADVLARGFLFASRACVIEEAERIVRHFAASDIAECRVWRVDLCVDATGFTFCREDEEHCVTRARGRVRFQAPAKVYTRRRGAESVVTGFVIAPGNELSVRIDKTEELLNRRHVNFQCSGHRRRLGGARSVMCDRNVHASPRTD
jgi:hypothetical protein